VAIMFQGTPGRVLRFDDPAIQAKAFVGGITPKIGFDTQLSIITNITLSQQANVQFLHTLGSLVFIYVFGDRIGQVGLSGFSFAAACNPVGPISPDLGPNHGAGQMLDWYRTNRVSSRQTPVQITIGSQLIEGFVTGFTENVIDPSTLLVQWNVTIQSMPDNSP
jgi:hypothetical protein